MYLASHKPGHSSRVAQSAFLRLIAPPIQRLSSTASSKSHSMEKTTSHNDVEIAVIEKPLGVDRQSSQDRSTMPGVDSTDANLARVDDAIEAIGWGRYHWQLAITCGFGFLVDQVDLSSHSCHVLEKVAIVKYVSNTVYCISDVAGDHLFSHTSGIYGVQS